MKKKPIKTKGKVRKPVKRVRVKEKPFVIPLDTTVKQVLRALDNYMMGAKQPKGMAIVTGTPPGHALFWQIFAGLRGPDFNEKAEALKEKYIWPIRLAAFPKFADQSYWGKGSPVTREALEELHTDIRKVELQSSHFQVHIRSALEALLAYRIHA